MVTPLWEKWCREQQSAPDPSMSEELEKLDMDVQADYGTSLKGELYEQVQTKLETEATRLYNQRWTEVQDF